MPTRRSFLHGAAATLVGAAANPTFQAAGGLDQTNAKAMIVATTGPAAIEHGLNAMRDGGSAADAVLTTALSQIALCAGCWVSYAGRMTAVYFDAETGKLHALNACYDAPRAEKNPMSIPRSPTPSGRNVLVPGFMAGLEALHSKFGKRPFSNLFQPSIKLAEDGFTLTNNLAGLIQRKQTVLTRYQGGREVFQNKNGTLYKAGDHFRQPQLAATLSKVAQYGAKFMYEGDWSKKFVETVRAENGRISLVDLKQYSPTWSEPLHTVLANGISVHGLPTPNRGGPLALACLNLANHAGISELGHYTQSIESLERILKIETAMRIMNFRRGKTALAKKLGREVLLNDCAESEFGKQLWNMIQSNAWKELLDELRQPEKRSEHSDAVVAVDPFGNMAAILHTINTAGWGTTGMFVDGVSIPDSGANQQSAIAEAGPGGRIADYGPPLIAMKNGRPVLAGSATGSGNVNASWQNFADVLLYGQTPQEAADTPNFYNLTFERNALETDFFQKAVDQGVPVRLKDRFGGFELGFWAGIGADPGNNELQSGKIRKLDGVTMQF